MRRLFQIKRLSVDEPDVRGYPALSTHLLFLPPFCVSGKRYMSTMKADPRHLNSTFNDSSVGSFKDAYAGALQRAVSQISSQDIENLCAAIVTATDNGQQIFTIGNGGSAAIAEHLCCDWTKGTRSEGYPVISSRSLTANNALYSAIANDYGYEFVFSTQLEFFAREGDLLIAISSSGNSSNIVNAALRAKALGLFLVGFTGFSGGKLKDLADVAIHVPVSNYGIVEDAHQAVVHIVAQYIARRRDSASGSTQRVL